MKSFRKDQPNLDHYTKVLVDLFRELESQEKIDQETLQKIIKKYPRDGTGVFAKDFLLQAYLALAGKFGLQSKKRHILNILKMKPTRTISGVAPVTVLTKPFPCPGKCIFCPNDIRMPKSYLADEPGAQRAERNWFDPYLQVYNRLQALKSIGHPTDKVEIIILGGTWSYYPENYQVWFIHECFRALSDFGIKSKDDRKNILQKYQHISELMKANQLYFSSDNPEYNQKRSAKHQIDGANTQTTYNKIISKLYVASEKKLGIDQLQNASWEMLEIEHIRNETAQVRCVGLVIETRPDNISRQEIVRIRKLGCTKAQIGIQSLQDEVLKKNKRGHDVAATRKAVALLRSAGFKIQAHWMANLYGSNLQKDMNDFEQLFADHDFCPDELKIYPCSLIQSAELMKYYQKGLWQAYTYDEMLLLLRHCLLKTPEYCRLTRVIRDISSDDIVTGNKKTNFRQIAEQSLESSGQEIKEIRYREIRADAYLDSSVRESIVSYSSSVSQEKFIQIVAKSKKDPEKEKILGYLRLSLPKSHKNDLFDELDNSAIIREIHVYGVSQPLGKSSHSATQHKGWGSKLIKFAQKIALEAGFEKLAVISAVGTREYYRKNGFRDGDYYQFYDLK